MADVTARDVADFMVQELNRRRELDQETVVYQIKRKFGDAFVYTNENGNLGIDKTVLREFRNLTPDVVWERGYRCWRKKNRFDESGKRQQD